MAACTTTFDLGTKPGWTARVAKRNAELLAQQPMRRRGVRTPEIIFTHHFDNTRLVKASDPVRVRQMRIFAADGHGVVLADHGLRPAAFQRHRRLVSQSNQRSRARSAARRESSASLDRSAALAAGPHRWHGTPAGTGRAAARPGRASLLRSRSNSAPVLRSNSQPRPPPSSR